MYNIKNPKRVLKKTDHFALMGRLVLVLAAHIFSRSGSLALADILVY